VTTGDGPPALRAGWRDALARGFVAFLAMVAIGQALALTVWFVADTRVSFGDLASIGWMYFGAFHHVAIELDVPDLAVAGAASGSTSLSIGVALLTLTAVAGVLLFVAGRRVADRTGGRPVRRVLVGAAVAPSYALPAFLLALLVRVRTPISLGATVTGDLHVALSPWQALAFPLAIAAMAGAAGGLRSALDARAGDEVGLRRLASAAAGAWRMLVVGLWLSLGGLFLAGVVQPDEPVALLTPSTARYFAFVFDAPAEGLVLLGHHVAAAPNEAMWTLVPSMGGCDGVRGSARADFLCYSRFPTSVGAVAQTLSGERAIPSRFGDATFDAAPPAYLTFLLVPGIATVLGGRRAARRAGVTGRDAVVIGIASGVVFAAFVGIVGLLSAVTIGYGGGLVADASGGWIVVGPDAVTGTLLALAWGVTGGALGAATARSLTSRTGSSTRGARTT
jgi:hypothetical protein